ncbi:DinB family protein [Umezawaea sp. Da 62-37]|uniref:DinB family protein n=1 Tax=Umezawaea sp. Da 62-37 TaxID=3075927 RepID=UPI0028F72D7E|nr:DinB family protein [Umezawaea sp. Da 62-37]WNV89098.1 DinB family protein [Umezawaea sp. Da 62-37]
MTGSITTTRTGERADLLETLGKHRFFLRHTTQGLTDEQAALSPTVSRLSLGGLVKHVANTEAAWLRFVLGGAERMEEDAMPWDEQHRMMPGETLAGLLQRYEEVARETDEVIAALPDLDVAHPLPVAPWFEAGKSWSARRVFLHLIAETSQHAGHADILRETIDGQRSMG